MDMALVVENMGQVAVDYRATGNVGAASAAHPHLQVQTSKEKNNTNTHHIDYFLSAILGKQSHGNITKFKIKQRKGISQGMRWTLSMQTHVVLALIRAYCN